MTDTSTPAPSDLARTALRDALGDAMPDDLLPEEHLDEVVDKVLAGLAARLGGFILDPNIIGLNAGVTVMLGGESVPAREVYLADWSDDYGNMIVQAWDGDAETWRMLP